MNYLSIYNQIINRAKNSNRRKRNISDPKYIYYEKHHIIPKCLGGTNDKSNFVLLTGSEHFLAHQLLVKIYPDQHKLVFALRSLCGRKNKNHIRNNKEYDWIKRLISETSSKSQKGKSYGHKYQPGANHPMFGKVGELNPNFGSKRDNDTKLLMSKKALERDPSCYDFARQPKSQSHKERISQSKQIRRFKLVSPNNTEYIFDTCKEASLFCGITPGTLQKLASNRYTFDNCSGWKCISMPL
jgi:hypothetical protein